eukprot:11157924-Lingulodinium_polyedra.AAC.1
MREGPEAGPAHRSPELAAAERSCDAFPPNVFMQLPVLEPHVAGFTPLRVLRRGSATQVGHRPMCA